MEGFAAAPEGTDLAVEIFPNGTLGPEDERLDQVARGLVQANLASVSTAFGMSPLMRSVLLPSVFEGAEEFDALMEGSDLMASMNEPPLPNGVRLAGFDYIGTGIGIRNTDTPITRMSDLEGLRLRAPNAERPAHQEALGATETIVAWSEMPNAIQTGIADGCFNPPNSAIRTGHTEFLRHLTQADIPPSTRAVPISEDRYAGLADDARAQVDAALEAGFEANRAWIAEWEGTERQRHDEAGVTISELEPGERDLMVETASATWADIVSEEELAAVTDALEALRS